MARPMWTGVLTFAEQVRKLVQDKAAGNEITVSEGEPAEAANVVDLMDALKRSVAAARSGVPPTWTSAAGRV